jgi:hypothetical protein
MGFQKIPDIDGPTYGGIIYGMNFKQGFSSESNILTLNIASANGRYNTPTLNSPATIRFGSFTFNGVVWSWSSNVSAGESVIEVQIKDNSVILDRHYVVCWKRGFPGGGCGDKSRFISLSDEEVLVPKVVGNGASINVNFEQRRLQGETIKRRVCSASYRSGGGIFLGRENWPDSNCDIPDSTYTFSDLLGNLPCSYIGAPGSTIKATHEGTLREVLKNWCSDLGYDFYWDFASNRLCFYNVQAGISSIPMNLSSPNIIRRSTGSTLDGTFRQYVISYTARPKQPLKELSADISITVSRNVNPVHIGYFVNRSSINEVAGGGGTSRSSTEIIKHAMVGYVSRSLRDLHIYLEGGGLSLLGFSGRMTPVSKKNWIELLTNLGYNDTISSLQGFYGKDLSDMDFRLCSYDPGVGDKLHDAEQELLKNVGKWYKIPAESGSFFYCSQYSFSEVNISAQPEGTVQEGESTEFSGRKMFDRGGQMSHDSTQLLSSLGLEKDNDSIQRSTPVIIDLKESGAWDFAIDAGIIKPGDKQNCLVLFPSISKVKSVLNLKVTSSTGQNPAEKTYLEIFSAQKSNSVPKCRNYEELLNSVKCEGSKDEARRIARAKLGLDKDSDNSEYPEGLVSKNAYSCSISINGGSSGRFFSPSYGQYRCIVTFSISTKQISKKSIEESAEKISSSGNIGQANDVAEIRAQIVNVTDSGRDEFGGVSSDFQKDAPKNETATSPTRSATYVFAGMPSDAPMNPNSGLSSIDVTFADDGFTTTLEYRSRNPSPPKIESAKREVENVLNRASFNAN